MLTSQRKKRKEKKAAAKLGSARLLRRAGAPMSGAALAAALDLYSQRKHEAPHKDYKKVRGLIAALSGAIGGAAASKLAKSLGSTASKAAVRSAKQDMSYLGKSIFFK